MKKFECDKCRFSAACTFNGAVKPEQCVVSKKFIPDWHEVKEETTTKSSQLPDWVKECAIGYDNEQERYFEVTNIDEKFVDIEFLDDGIGATCSHADMQKCSEAVKRLFNDKEMKNLVGNIAINLDGGVSMITDYDCFTKELRICGEMYSPNELFCTSWQIDGKPCFKLEHLENGEWVE